MRKMLAVSVVSLGALGLTACDNMSRNEQYTAGGAAAGTAAGALLGGSAGSAALGGLAGAAGGYAIGRATEDDGRLFD